MKKLVVVANLDIDKVTWANSFTECASENGIKVISEPESFKVKASKIFIGDSIKRSRYPKGGLYKNIYFLGASSIGPSDSPSKSKINLELANMLWADMNVVVSQSELKKVTGQNSGLKKKTFVLGFPVNFPKMRRSAHLEKKENSVCFLGEIRRIKNPDFEIKLCRYLSNQGYSCFHLSPFKIARKKELLNAGCQTIENIRGNKYLRKLATFEFFVSVSLYESLAVSGIEASLLGCIPVVPDHSGFLDWCPPQNRYREYDVGHISKLLESLKTRKTNLELDQYSGKNFFREVLSHL